MSRKIMAIALALVIAFTFISCSSSKKSTLNTDALKKFVQDSKKNGKMSYDKTKKAYKGIFPKIKMK
jgi:hypothetical protein